MKEGKIKTNIKPPTDSPKPKIGWSGTNSHYKPNPIPVTYGGIVVGHSVNGDTIKFLDTPEAKEVIDIFKTNERVFISSRAVGEIKEDNIVEREEPTELVITKMKTTKPIPPLSRIIGEFDTSFCDICGSGIKETWYGKKLGCKQPKCDKYYKN